MKRVKSVLGENIYNENTLQFQFIARLVGTIVAIILMKLSDYQINYSVFIPIAIIFVVYCFVVRFTKLKMNLWFQKINLFIDVLIITVMIAIRGGLRSDYYLGYFIILGYVILLRDTRLLFHINLWIIVSYTIATFGFSDSMDVGRLLIRLTLMMSTMLCLYNYSRILSEETSLRLSVSNLALKDPLTNVYNRNILTTIESVSYGDKVCMALLDIDDFKSVNDTYGHVYGDEVLRRLGGLLNEHLTDDDMAIRYGGEEFLLILQHDIKLSSKKLEKMSQSFAGFKYKWMANQITFSVGLVECKENQSLETCISEADKRLYMAKNSGKNQIV